MKTISFSDLSEREQVFVRQLERSCARIDAAADFTAELKRQVKVLRAVLGYWAKVNGVKPSACGELRLRYFYLRWTLGVPLPNGEMVPPHDWRAFLSHAVLFSMMEREGEL